MENMMGGEDTDKMPIIDQGSLFFKCKYLI